MKREICTVKKEVKNSASRQRPRNPFASVAKRHFFRVSIFVFKNRLKKWGLSRTALAAKIIFLSAVSLADCADCQAYKTQVVNDCDSLHSLIQGSLSDLSSIAVVSQSGANATLGSTQGNDQLSNAYFNSILSTSASLNSTLNSLDTFVTSIRSTAQSLQCNASSNTVGSCDCSQYLQTLIGLVQTCNQTVSGISSGLDSVRTVLGSSSPDFNSIIVTLNNTETNILDLLLCVSSFLEWDDGDIPLTVGDFYTPLSDIARSLTNFNITVSNDGNLTFRYFGYSLVPSTIGVPSVLTVASTAKHATIRDIIYYGIRQILREGGSLNNFAYTNTIAIATIARKLDGLTNTTSNALLDYIVEVDRPPLLDSSSSDYFAALTNSYLATWSANDNPNTNWFRRVEILLASLVFKNYDNHDSLADSATNSISSLDTARSTFVDSVNAEDLFSFDLGSEYLDSPPSLPEFGDQLPDTLIITIPRYNDSNLNSETHNDQIEISGLNQYSTIFDLVRVFFRLVWWAIVVILVFVCFKYFFAFCKFSFNLFTKFTFK